MLLLNVVFFNGLWELPFNTNETKSEPFYLNNVQNINVKMMKSQHVLDYTETPEYDLQLVRLPYMVSNILNILVDVNNDLCTRFYK